MANRYTGKIIVIDTTDTQVGGPLAVSDPKGSLHILGMQWVTTQNSGKDIAADDDLIIKYENSSGSIVIEARAESGSAGTAVTALSAVAWEMWPCQPWVVPGLYIEDIDGGELIIYLA